MRTFTIALIATLMIAACGRSQDAGDRQSRTAPAQPATWMVDAAKAQELARAGHKLVLLDFTGSDWCPWCFRLRDEIFNTPAFQEYAKNNLVLVEVDFPRRKAIADSQKMANEALAVKYRIEGFPTVIVLDSEGRLVGELGYEEGGPKPFIGKLEKMR